MIILTFVPFLPNNIFSSERSNVSSTHSPVYSEYIHSPILSLFSISRDERIEMLIFSASLSISISSIQSKRRGFTSSLSLLPITSNGRRRPF
jgi:hypothetical protein